MTSLCYKCELDVGDDDFAECDNCDNLFHLKCVGTTKTESKARKNSKCLRIYCPECIDSKSNGTFEKLKEILAVLYKLDLFNQQQKTSNIANLPQLIESKLNALTASFSSAIESNNVDNALKRNKPSYADISKRNVKPTVVIKPKKSQHCAKTFEDLSNNVEKSKVNVCSTRNIRNGGVVLRCENASETMKVKQIVDEKLGQEYDVVLPKIKSPRLRVTNIDTEIPKDEILNELIKHNVELTYADMRLITVIHRNYKNHSYNDVVIELKSDTYKSVLDHGNLRLPWRECRVFEHLHLNRCYKCCGFSHKSDKCKQEQKCSRCAGPHKYSECKNTNVCCVNCKFANDKYKMNIDTNHHTFSKECPTFKRRITALVNKIEYNISE